MCNDSNSSRYDKFKTRAGLTVFIATKNSRQIQAFILESNDERYPVGHLVQYNGMGHVLKCETEGHCKLHALDTVGSAIGTVETNVFSRMAGKYEGATMTINHDTLLKSEPDVVNNAKTAKEGEDEDEVHAKGETKTPVTKAAPKRIRAKRPSRAKASTKPPFNMKAIQDAVIRSITPVVHDAVKKALRAGAKRPTSKRERVRT